MCLNSILGRLLHGQFFFSRLRLRGASSNETPEGIRQDSSNPLHIGTGLSAASKATRPSRLRSFDDPRIQGGTGRSVVRIDFPLCEVLMEDCFGGLDLAMDSATYEREPLLLR